MDKKTLIIIGLVITILIGLSYFLIIPKYNLWQLTKGFQIGYSQAIIDVMQRSATCQEVPLSFQNQTIIIKAIGCN